MNFRKGFYLKKEAEQKKVFKVKVDENNRVWELGIERRKS